MSEAHESGRTPAVKLPLAEANSFNTASAGGPGGPVASRGPWEILWRKLRRDRMALAGGATLIVLYLMALFAGFVSPYSYRHQFRVSYFQPPAFSGALKVRDTEGNLCWPYVNGFKEELVETDDGMEMRTLEDTSVSYPLRFFHDNGKEDAYTILWIFGPFQTHLYGVDSPGVIYLLGSDNFGRDILSRLVYGAQISLSIGLVGILISMSLGMLVGGIAGFYSDRNLKLIELVAIFPAIALVVIPFSHGERILGFSDLGMPQVLFLGVMAAMAGATILGTRSNGFRLYLLASLTATAAVIGHQALRGSDTGLPATPTFFQGLWLTVSFWLTTLPSLAWLVWRLERLVAGTATAPLLLFDRTVTIDFLIMRVIEVILAVPGLYLILTLRFAFPRDLSSTTTYMLIIVILAFIGWASNARVIRGMVLSLKEREFVIAAQALGVSDFVIIVKHILPNTLSYVIVTATLYVPYYILGEVSLSFLGIGIQEPDTSWGLMLKDAQHVTKLQNYPWLVVPGLMIFIAVLAYNFLGDGLRDAADPRTVVAMKQK